MPAMPSDSNQLDQVIDDDPRIAKAFDAIHSALNNGRYREAIAKREAFYLPGIVAGLESGFPTIADIEEALERHAFRPKDLRVYSGREPLDLDQQRFVNRGIIEPQMLANAALLGSTLIFNFLQKRLHRAHRLAQLFEEWLGDAIEFVMVASFASECGFKPHHDETHLLIVQLAGVKKWTLIGDPVTLGAPALLGQENDPQRQLTMNSGDVLYVPSGQRHFCNADNYSLHLAITLEAPTGRVLQQRLEKLLNESIMLQEPVPAILGPDHVSLMAMQLRSHLHGLIDQLDIKKIIEQERRHRKIRPRVKLRPRTR
jgi:Cupin superfamily protein